MAPTRAGQKCLADRASGDEVADRKTGRRWADQQAAAGIPRQACQNPRKCSEKGEGKGQDAAVRSNARRTTRAGAIVEADPQRLTEMFDPFYASDELC